MVIENRYCSIHQFGKLTLPQLHELMVPDDPDGVPTTTMSLKHMVMEHMAENRRDDDGL